MRSRIGRLRVEITCPKTAKFRHPPGREQFPMIERDWDEVAADIRR
jgi:hypothetical protein